MSEQNVYADPTSRGVNFVLRQRRFTAQMASSAVRRFRVLAGPAAAGALTADLRAAFKSFR